jgi:predicted nuclease of restriction endonuclease-like (RecB) superfamily
VGEVKTQSKGKKRSAAKYKGAAKSLSPRAAPVPEASQDLLRDLRVLIEQARGRVAQAINSELVMLYWRVGRRINEDVLKGRRAKYGKQIFSTLSGKLSADYGRGFSQQNLFRMSQLAEVFPDEQIIYTLSRELSWSHFVEILPLKDQLMRDFYAEMSRIERWSVRTLRQKIGGMLYERTALSKKPDKLIKQELLALREEDRLTPDLIFRDPYLLDFLGLKDTYSEKDVETAILRELERFLLELGAGFTFVARQKRITVDNEDFYLDLLFYNRKLRRMVAVELKLEKFKPADKGQMELYLRWLEKYEQEPGEESPIGLILCASKSEEQIELLQLSKSGIRVAAYLTELPPRELLRRKLHEATVLARARLESGELPDESQG